MEKDNTKGFDERSLIISKLLGFTLIGLGVYGLFISLKTYKK